LGGKLKESVLESYNSLINEKGGSTSKRKIKGSPGSTPYRDLPLKTAGIARGVVNASRP